MGLRKVSKAKFDAFVKKYPRKLVRDTTGICTPPITRYNDFSDGKAWPESLVAKVVLCAGHPAYPKNARNEYYVLEK